MKVCHLVYNLIRGGTEGQCAQVAMELTSRKLVDSIVAVFHRRGYYLSAVEKTCGKVYEFKIRKMFSMQTLAEIRNFAKFLRQEKVDVLHAWDADAIIFGQFAARLAKCRFVASHRDLAEIYQMHKRLLFWHADKSAVAVAVNAEAIRDRLIQTKKVAAEKIHLLPNVLNVDVFRKEMTAEFSLKKRLPMGRRMVAVNRLEAEKNVSLLLHALVLVRKEIPNAVLLIAGDGGQRRELEALAKKLGLTESVRFLGDILDVPALLEECEVAAIVPNRNEGFSNALMEYMMAGLPAMATDCGGNRELITHGKTGLLIPKQATPAEAAEAWKRLLTQQEEARQMAVAAKEHVIKLHALDFAIQKFVDFYAPL